MFILTSWEMRFRFSPRISIDAADDRFSDGALEMTSLSQSPRDRILWILANNGGKMERSRLRARTGMRYTLLNPNLEELAKEGRIKMTVGKQEDSISLMVR
jgi:hypothetical protein